MKAIADDWVALEDEEVEEEGEGKDAMRALFEEEGEDSLLEYSLLEYSLYDFPKFHHSGSAGFPIDQS